MQRLMYQALENIQYSEPDLRRKILQAFQEVPVFAKNNAVKMLEMTILKLDSRGQSQPGQQRQSLQKHA